MTFSKENVVTLSIIIAVLLGALCVVGFIKYTSIQEQKPIPDDAILISDDAGAYTDIEGRPFSFNALEGKVRVINFWASWCPFCIAEIQMLDTLAKEFPEENVAFVAVNRKESMTTAKSFLKKIGTTDRILYVQDTQDTLYQSAGGYSMPETLIYDANGERVYHNRGTMRLDEMKARIMQALQAE